MLCIRQTNGIKSTGTSEITRQDSKLQQRETRCPNNKIYTVPLEKHNVNFSTHTLMSNADGLLENTSSLQKVAAEQVASIKAEVVQMSGLKTIHTMLQITQETKSHHKRQYFLHKSPSVGGIC